MVRRLLITVFCLVITTVLSSGPRLAIAGEQKTKADTADSKKDEKDAQEETGVEKLREGINQTYDEFKKEAAKAKKNLNDLNERSTTPSKDVKEK
jgi:hypothetical protein